MDFLTISNLIKRDFYKTIYFQMFWKNGIMGSHRQFRNVLETPRSEVIKIQFWCGTFTFRSNETHLQFIPFCVWKHPKTANLLFFFSKKITNLKCLNHLLHRNE
jgi:hypothetical protein